MSQLHALVAHEKNINNRMKYRSEEDIKRLKSVMDSNLKPVYLTIGSNDTVLGRIEISMFDDIAPRVCKNFRDRAVSDSTSFSLINMPLPKIVENMIVEGGNIEVNIDTRYANTLDGDSFDLSHDRPYLVGTKNISGKNSGIPFYITCMPTPWFDQKYLIFGEIVDETSIRTLKEVQKFGHFTGEPTEPIKIIDCGVVEKK